MKLALVMLALIGVMLAFNANRLPFGNIASPVDVQRTIFDNVHRSIR